MHCCAPRCSRHNRLTRNDVLLHRYLAARTAFDPSVRHCDFLLLRTLVALAVSLARTLACLNGQRLLGVQLDTQALVKHFTDHFYTPAAAVHVRACLLRSIRLFLLPLISQPFDKETRCNQLDSDTHHRGPCVSGQLHGHYGDVLQQLG